MTEPGLKPTADATLQVRELKQVRKIAAREMEKVKRPRLPSRYGKYTWDLDGALPGPHAMALYNALFSEEARTLVQCRTDHSHLRNYLYRINRAPTRECACGQGDETVLHVLLECRMWIQLRATLRTEVEERFGDISYMLGGYSKRIDGQTGRQIDGPLDKWNPVISRYAAFVTAQFY